MAGSQLMNELAKGNPGAIAVVVRLDFVHLNNLKLFGINGSMIWVAYKDICGEDMDLLKQKIEDGSIEHLVKNTPDWKYEVKAGLR